VEHPYLPPVSVTWPTSERFILCMECAPNVIEDDMGTINKDTKREGRRDKDDEEEWGGIPIPHSDDSSSTDEWLSEEPDNNEDNKDDHDKNYLNCFVAFLIAPRKDGRVLTKDGQIINVNECPIIQGQQQAVTLSQRLPAAKLTAPRPHWTKHLFAYQRCQLKKGYKYKKRTMKVQAKQMRQVHQQIRDTATMTSRENHTLVQCMNALQSPTRTNKHQRSPVKRSPPNNLLKRSKHRFSPSPFPVPPISKTTRYLCW
jgi:hypothetical protein